MTQQPTVRWAELKPDGFRERQRVRPVVYLPLGLCEPHGHVAALGLDTLKADYYCDEAARRTGGIVAPTQGYHIHECGFHAPWLEAVVGEENPFLGGLPPHVMGYHFLYQLRAFANAGFGAVIAVSGHAGGSQEDLRRVAQVFSRQTGLRVTLKTDPEWVAGQYVGDHAGKYELSQLLAIRPDLVDLSLIKRQDEPGSGGRLALGDDAGEATAEFGRAINEAIVRAIIAHVEELAPGLVEFRPRRPITYEETEAMWTELAATLPEWRSVSPQAGQPKVTAGSRWQPYERVAQVLRPKR